MQTKEITNCFCGKPLHYSDPAKKKMLDDLSAELGEFITVKNISDGKEYKVQRHYIALHGIKGKDLASLGFEEIVHASDNGRKGKR